MPGLKATLSKLTRSKAESKSPRQVVPSERVDWLKPATTFSVGRHLGFAVDENSVQMAAARHNGLAVTLTEVSRVDLSQQTDPNARKRKIETSIQQFVQRHGGRRAAISISVSGPETALRTSIMPDLGRSQLASAVMYDTKRLLPFPQDECIFDFRPAQRITTESGRRLKISVLAATRRLVKDTLASFDDLGYEVSFLRHSQDVTGQLLSCLPNFSPDSGYALINIQHHGSEIAFYHGTTLEFVHIISIGSSFLGDRNDPTTFEYFAESLASEVQNSLDYYSGQYSTNFANQVYLYGDLSYTDELQSLLSERLGLSFLRFPTERLDFVHKGDASWHADLPLCLPAVAAATNRVKLPNLLPPERKQASLNRSAHRIGIAALLVLMCFFGAHWYTTQASMRTAREHLNYLQQQVETFRASESFKTYNHLKRSIARSQAYINKAKESPSYLGLNLKELTHMAPSLVKLQTLDYRTDSQNRNMHLTGEIVTEQTPPELTLAEFVENLEASPFYENVEVTRNRKMRIPEGFKLEFLISMKGII